MSATVSGPTSSASVELFRRSATASYKTTPSVCVVKTASSSSERGGRLSSLESSLSPPPPHPSLAGKLTPIKPLGYDHEEEILKSDGGGEVHVSESVCHDDDDVDEWSDWEDRILEETVPLVGFVRTIIHSRKYKIGERLRPEHQKIILERLLPYHPEYEEKIGCGVEAIMVEYHTEFKGTKCLFIIRKDGQQIDFSYWKCIKGLIRKKYPLHADAFIVRHFRRHRPSSRAMRPDLAFDKSLEDTD